MDIGQGFHAEPSPTFGSLPAGLIKVVYSFQIFDGEFLFKNQKPCSPC